MSEEQGKMTFMEHLEELRRRLIYCAAAVLGGMIICWFFREQILAFLEAPLKDAWNQVPGLPEQEPLRFASLLEPFVAYLKLAAIGGVFLGAPVILYNLWKFIAPGLYPKEKRVALPFVLVSSVLFIGGSTMAYSLVFPIGFSFFLDFAAGGESEEFTATATITEASKTADPGSNPVIDPPAKPQVTRRGLPDSPDNESKLALADAGALQRAAFPDGGLSPNLEGDAGPGDLVEGEVAPTPAEEFAPIPTEEGEPDAGAEPEEALDTEEESPAWWDVFLKKLLLSSCGVLEVVPSPEGGALLSFAWDERTCDEAPELTSLYRGEEEVEVEWVQAEEKDEGSPLFEAVDPGAPAGEHEYTLTVVTGTVEAGKLMPMLMMKDYLSFAIRLLLAFGIIFELPILITFLALAGIVNYKQLLRFSRWFIVLSVVLSAMLTPPDVVTQILLATPLTVLYFLSILVAYIFGPKVEE